MKKFLLVDGNAILHRAFHALPPLTNKDGNLVNAVYGFFSMFLKILSEVKPDYAVVCFDRPKPTFRQALYVGYQAHRPKMDDTLIPQIQTVHEILAKAKYNIFEIDGYEADDLIGTISKKVVDDFNSEVIIVSGDRDMLQLVNSHVKVLSPITGITKMILFDEKLVEEKYGIKPLQIIDYKSLAGDSSDNYPGVPGVGPKTASALLKEYGTLENLYQSLDQVKQKNENLSLKLASGIESAGLAKKLATIVKDAPVTINLDSCSISDNNIDLLVESFRELGFKSLLNRASNNNSSKTEKKVQKKEKREEREQLGLL
ncbi:MAG: hypothetical protein M1524_01190 [Patescibacteria group bacterium]|nr:hypothetical protein [Patescibacteria group bacterium]